MSEVGAQSDLLPLYHCDDCNDVLVKGIETVVREYREVREVKKDGVESKKYCIECADGRGLKGPE